MPLSSDNLICPKFQPNIFDSSRCHDCLRQKHLHAGTPATQQVSPGTNLSQGQQLVPEEKDSSAKEDSDVQSVVSSYCDVSGDQRGYEESSLHILSPDCQLYLCDGDDDEDSTDSQDQCDYPDFFYSASADDDYPPVHRRSDRSSMTRLDPPPHRPNPRAWMEESRSKDSFGRHSVGSRGDRERESGYFSLGKAGGIRSSRDQSPSLPYRHLERGHPIPNNRSPDRKDTIPFRNPDLGVPSHRRSSEFQNPDFLEESPPPEPTPLERSIEVEAQVGPRSPSPTPFRQAEAFASNKTRKSAFSRGKSPSEHSSSQQQSRRGSSLSRSSSPARGTSSSKRSESVVSLNSRSPGSSAFSQGLDHRSRSPSSQNSFGRGLDSGGVQKDFRSIASSVGSKSLSSSYADLRGSLRKAESTTSLASRGLNSHSSSPSRRGFETPGQSMLRKSETNGVLSGHGRDTRSSSISRNGAFSGHGRDTRSSSPSRNGAFSGHGRDTRSSSPSRNGVLSGHGRDTRSSSPSRNGAFSGHGRDTRSSSPSRRGYDTPGQSMLPKSDTSSSAAYGPDRKNASPTRKSNDHQGHSFSQKTERNSSSYSRDSQSPSPSRKGLETTRPSIKHINETKSSLSRSSSPSRKGYDTSSQSVLRFTETSRPIHCQGLDSRSPSPSRKGSDTLRQSVQRKSETDRSRSISGCNSRSSSPSKRGIDPSSQSALRKTVSYDSRTSVTTSQLKKSVNSHGRSDSNPPPSSWRGSSRSLSSPPISRSPSPSRKISENRPLERSQRPSSAVLGNGRNGNRSISSSSSRHIMEHRSLSPEARKSSGQNRSQSPQLRRLTSSQSSMDSTESSHLSGGSTGFNKEEYAMLADLPKVKTIFHKEGPNRLGKLESHPSGEERLYKPASHSHIKNSYNNLDSGGDQNDGRLTRTHSSTSLHVQGGTSPTMEEVQPQKGQQRSQGQSQRKSQGRPSVYFSPSVESAEESPFEQACICTPLKAYLSAYYYILQLFSYGPFYVS